MATMNVLSLGDISSAMALDKQREMNNWVERQHIAAALGQRPGAFDTARAGVGALLIRVGGWVGGARVAPRLTRQAAH
jgi:hypothetical protein